ncbi:hypothetical protein ACKWTF_006101 [Chironomus riparius]
MNRSMKKDTIADRISDILKPKELTEERDENEAKLENFDEHIEINQLSDIRKQTARNLSELDKKYKGKVVSREQIEKEYGNSGSDDDDLLTESEDVNEEESDNSEDVEAENSDSDADNDDSGDGSDDESEQEDDFDISQFISKEQHPADVKSTEEHSTKLVNKETTSNEVKKGICVQNQLKIWEKLLEVRIKSQKMLITANSFPDFDSFIELSEVEGTEFADKIETACDGVYNLLDNLLELQTTLVDGFSESKNVLKSCKRKNEENNGSLLMKRSKLAQYADRIEDNYDSYSKFRNQVLQKWNDRTKSLKDTKNPVTNLNIMTKIENALLGKNEMIRKTQIYRGDYEIFGVEIPKKDDESQNDVHIPDIFDDSDFYHQLLRELIEYKSNTGDNQSELAQKFMELQNVRSKMKKRVETRASKGRKIRYNVHNKLVNFMPPKDTTEMTEEAKTELFNSLFGRANTQVVN